MKSHHQVTQIPLEMKASTQAMQIATEMKWSCLVTQIPIEIRVHHQASQVGDFCTTEQIFIYSHLE